MVRRGPNKWCVVPPTHCAHGHALLPGNVLVGHMPCRGHRIGHNIWHCLTCPRDELPTFGPPSGTHCTVLDGPAVVWISASSEEPAVSMYPSRRTFGKHRS